MKDGTSYRTGGGGAGALAGLPMLLFGMTFTAAGVLVARAELERADGTPLAGLPFALVGAGVTLGGLAVLFGRAGVSLDGSRRTVTRWWSLLGVRVRSRVSSVPDVALVTFERVARRSGKTTIVVHPVRIGGATGETTLLGEPRDRDEARRIAELAGKAFGADVEDRTQSTPNRRRADQLDQSLRQQHRDAPPPAPRRPASLTCTYRPGRSQTTIEVPAAMPSAMPMALAGGGCVAALFVLPMLVFGLATGFPPAMLAFMGAVWGLLALAGLPRVLRSARRAGSPTHLEVGRDAVAVVWPGERAEIPTDRLEEVGLDSPRPGDFFLGERMLLVSDERTIEVPLRLDEAERAWVIDVVRWVAATGEAPPEAADAA